MGPKRLNASRNLWNKANHRLKQQYFNIEFILVPNVSYLTIIFVVLLSFSVSSEERRERRVPGIRIRKETDVEDIVLRVHNICNSATERLDSGLDIGSWRENVYEVFLTVIRLEQVESFENQLDLKRQFNTTLHFSVRNQMERTFNLKLA